LTKEKKKELKSKERKLTSFRWGVDESSAIITPLLAFLVLGFFLNNRGLFAGSVVSGGIFGSSAMASV
jgi:hypothetical protein